jgi:uncharacterized membrane protein YbhN (UPF0104 family)
VTSRRPAIRRAAVAVLVLVVLAFFAYAVVDAWDATGGVLPSVARFAVAVGLWAVGLVCGSYAWAVLLGGEHRIEHGAALIVAQLAKYVPGGVWQVSGQVALARSAGVEVRRAATAFSVLAVCQAVAGFTFVPLLAITWTDAPIAVRVLLGVGSLASLALIDRRWMVWVLARIPRTRDASHALVPSQGAIVRAWVAGVVALVLATIAYLVLLGGYGSVPRVGFVAAAFATAWTVGFLVIPLPSGLGLREAVLVGLLHGLAPTSVVVATSVYQRLATIVAEAVMAAIVSHRVRPSRLAAARAAVRARDGADDAGSTSPDA